MGDTSAGPNSERPTWHSYSASSLRSQASISRWNSPGDRATKVNATISASASGSQVLASLTFSTVSFQAIPREAWNPRVWTQKQPILRPLHHTARGPDPAQQLNCRPFHRSQVFRNSPEASRRRGGDWWLGQAWGHRRLEIDNRRGRWHLRACALQGQRSTHLWSAFPRAAGESSWKLCVSGLPHDL